MSAPSATGIARRASPRSLHRRRSSLDSGFVQAVEQIVADHPNQVLDLDAGHPHIMNPSLFARVEAALRRCLHVLRHGPTSRFRLSARHVPMCIGVS